MTAEDPADESTAFGGADLDGLEICHPRWRNLGAGVATLLMVIGAGCGYGPDAEAFRPSRAVSPMEPSSPVSVFDTITTDVRVASAPPIPSTSQPAACSGMGVDGQASADPFRSSTLVGASITAGAGECGQQVVIGFTQVGDLPAWGARYVDGPINDDVSGGQATLAGDATLLVTVGAWMGVMGAGYDGPNSITLDDAAGVTELRLVANADGTSVWAIGLTDEVPFTVVEQRNPSQIVVQFAPVG